VTYVVPRPRNGLSLCAGAGGLDMGLGLAEPGFHTRCYVEWEEHPRSAIIAAQRAGYFPPAPIWDDVTTFDAKPLAGAIDTLIGGYPCQGESLAGKRLGTEDERWLWDDFARIIRELGPHLQWCFFENVRGHVSSGLQTVLRSLRDMGFTTSVGIFSAGETGAPHERQRVFIVAYRAREGICTDIRGTDTGTDGWHQPGRGGRNELADPSSPRHSEWGQPQQPAPTAQDGTGLVAEPERCGGRPMGNTPRLGCGEGQSEPIVRSGRYTTASAGGELDDPECIGRDAGRHRDHGCNDGVILDTEGSELADASGTGPQGGEQRGSSGQRDGTQTHGRAAQRSRPWLFPPGPSDSDGWLATLAVSPDLAPTVTFGDVARRADQLAQMVASGELEEAQAEPALCGMVDGLAQRTRALKLLGNGVQPLAAGHAWRTLSNAHGLRPLDLGAATGNTPSASADGYVRGDG